MKKVLALALATIMVLALCGAALADTTYDITIPDTDTHTYKIYQVLTGTLGSATSKQLGNPEWGTDVSSSAITAAGYTSVDDFITAISAATTEVQIASLVSAIVDLTSSGQGTVDNTAAKALAPGYYVLVDVTTLTGDTAYDTKALNVVQVVGDVTINKKWDTTTDDKIITTDTLGADDPGTTINGKIDNVSIGDTVNFQITAKVPAKASDYNYFYFVINDTMDPGLTFTTGSIKVYHGSVANANELTLGTRTAKDGGTGYTATGDYVVEYPDSGCTFKVALNDAKAYANENIIVTYSAVLNKDAKIITSNDNTSTVTYSNNPNHEYDGTNYPGFPSSGEDTYLGETPETRTKTYTTGIIIQKVDEKGKPLTGVEFTISGTSLQLVVTETETFTADAAGNYYHTTDGLYTKAAPTQDRMEVITGTPTAGWVEDPSGTLTVGGTTYREYVPETDGSLTVYKYIQGTASKYEKSGSDYVMYKKTVVRSEAYTPGSTGFAETVDANGLAEFIGLGAGNYTIKETVTPAGYNTISDLTLTIVFDPATEAWSWTFSGSGSYDATEGVYKFTVENHTGAELPTTGGIGTTIFYVSGLIMVLGAAVILVARRRADAE